MDNTCKTCNRYTKSSSPSGYSWISGILLAVLPKCPFCILAYSSTMMLCTEGSIISNQTTHISPLTIIITLLLTILTLIGISMNRRGKRTLYALLIALTGISLIFSSVIWVGGELLYYTGIAIVFIAIWLNGSMLWFFSRLQRIRNERNTFIQSSK